MEKFSIYKDIQERTNGDIYIGVVGPVRCGKSTFITKFMETIVLPNIKNKHIKERTIDELPQSSDGKTIMTTQPKFVPNEAVKIKIGNIDLSIRLIDSVGFLIKDVLGHTENNKPRLVHTPWTEKEIPFEEASEIGTKKIIEDHSTIGLMLTSDGTINNISRESYLEAEQKTFEELKRTEKPFIIILNSTEPNSEKCQNLRESLEKKYETPVLAIDVLNLKSSNIEQIFEKMIYEFPIKSLKISLPKWMQSLSFNDNLITEIIQEITETTKQITKIGQINKNNSFFKDNENFEEIKTQDICLGEGCVYFKIEPKPNLFYEVLSKQCGTQIDNDFKLIQFIKELAIAKKTYEKFEEALNQVEMTGYGIVNPQIEDLTLDDPQIVKQGSRFCVKLKATAPSLHIMKVDIETEINPLVGTEQQSQELVQYLSTEFENNPDKIWDTNMFGKSLHTLVTDGIKGKILKMPTEAQKKMRKTLTKIVNEGKGGIICILL